jgi:hypothetical protein
MPLDPEQQRKLRFVQKTLQTAERYLWRAARFVELLTGNLEVVLNYSSRAAGAFRYLSKTARAVDEIRSRINIAQTVIHDVLTDPV